MERVAHWTAPIGRIPVRIAAFGLGGIRWLTHVVVSGLFRTYRWVVRVATPLRYVLVLALIALLGGLVWFHGG